MASACRSRLSSCFNSLINYNVFYASNKSQFLSFSTTSPGYAVKKPISPVSSKSKVSVPGAVIKPKRLEPVTDAERLGTHLCGGNIMKEGEDPILKTESEYPEWLWNLSLERRAPPLESLDKDSWQYWRRALKLDKKRRSRDRGLQYKHFRF